jgi:hypothetical protein
MNGGVTVQRMRVGRWLIASLGLVLTAYACGGTSGDRKVKGGSSGTAGAAGTGGESAGNAGTGGGDSGRGGSLAMGGGAGRVVIDPGDAGPDPDVMIEPDAACGIGSAEATLRPVSILVMFDRSTSMISESTIDAVTGLDRWETATNALKQFFSEPGAGGIGVALRFFPHDSPSVGCTQEGCCTDESCFQNTPEAVAACADVLVGLGTLTAEPAEVDAQEALLLDAIDTSIPMDERVGGVSVGGTPISAALGGATAWALQHQGENPEGHTAILFVTDGAPAGCDERTAFIAGLAAEAYDSAGITTFAIGLADAEGEGVHEELMNEIASAGGTEEAFFIEDGPSAAEELLATLDAIRGLALPCDFPMPKATTEGKDIDPGLVNVIYTSGEDEEQTLTKLAEGASCADSESWFYDDETDPTRVELCPAACQKVSTDPQAKLQILVGCLPILEPPR